MKNQRIVALSILFLIFMNFISLWLALVPLESKNHMITEDSSNNPSKKMNLEVNSENLFEFFSRRQKNFAPLSKETLGQNSNNHDSNFAYLPAMESGTIIVKTNGTGIENQVFRVNESMEFFASVLDVDGPLTKLLTCAGNATITGTQLNATNFSGNYTACEHNDEVYHTYFTNSSGQIVMAYFVNLSDFGINYDNISQINVSIEGKLGYSNKS
ncbi:MAG: hypothetical protein ACFFD2_27515, partial [Promethearchaeota archaeon]